MPDIEKYLSGSLNKGNVIDCYCPTCKAPRSFEFFDSEVHTGTGMVRIALPNQPTRGRLPKATERFQRYLGRRYVLTYKCTRDERDRKGSIQTTQEVEIYFNFVGRFVPPAFGEVELTPEELEEIRKREERKDRLHQNYLKRKASGAQKRYEDKIKGRKKAEIEAKKAAIRAEDIAKGVFVPVSSLPQREPMKGVQTA